MLFLADRRSFDTRKIISREHFIIRTKLFSTFIAVMILCAVENAQAAEDILITNAETSNVYISGITGIDGETVFRPWFTDVETILNVEDIIISLDLGYDVIITTATFSELTGNPGEATPTPGNIVVDAAILKSADGDGSDGSLLTFLADNDIIVNQSITSVLGGLDVELQAPGSIVIRADINANGGQLDLSVDTDEPTTDGAEILDIQATLTAAAINLDGGIAVGNDALIVSLAGVDTASWNISAANVGTVEAGTFSAANFTNFTILNGGDQSDTFNLSAEFDGFIDGAGGANSLNISTASGAVTVNLANNSATPLDGGGAGGFSNIASFTGDNVNDTLIGPNGGATFATAGVNDGTVGGSTYTDFANITGGTGADTFSLNHDVTGTIDGGVGNDVIVGSGVANAFVVNAADSGTVNGIVFVNAENLTGGASGDVFTITASLTGTASGAGGSDEFHINDGGSVGSINGGADSDLVTYAGRIISGVTVAINTFQAVEALVGSTITNPDTLHGTNGADTFTMTSVNAGIANGVSFSGFENLSGLGDDDTFNMNGTLSGTVDGGTDGLNGDVIIGTSAANAFVVNASDSGVVNGVSFFNVENLTGGASGDVFTITANLTGTASGASGSDVFNINDGGSIGSINGGADSDLVSYAGRTSAVTVAIDMFPAVEALVGSAQFDTLQGTSLADTFTLIGADSGIANGVSFSSFENISGLGGADVFNMNAGVSGTVDGGDGSDVIVGAAAANEFVVNAADSGTVNGTLFVNAENLTGGASGDIFTITAGLSGTASGAGGSDIFDLAPNITATIDGGAGDDEAVVREPAANDLNIGNVENITYIPQPLPWVTFRVQGIVDYVDPALDSVFSLGDTYNLVYTFDSTTPDSDASSGRGFYDAMLSAHIKVGSYSASLSSFEQGWISVDNLTNDTYRIDLIGISGPPAAGLPLGNQTALLQLTDLTGAAFSSDALRVEALDLNEFSGGFIALAFDVEDDFFPGQQAFISSSVDTFELVKSFRDVPLDYWASSFITRLAASGITAGCGNDNYCPTAPVTRAQMAVFLERGININDLPFVPPAASGNVFLDVGAGDFAASFIEQLFSDGITAGCGNNNYCPNALVSRAQMAVFLLRAKYGSSYSPQPATGLFADAPLGSFAVAYIEQLAAEGITAGCGGGNYCPNAEVTRDQMAVFLVRTFGL